MEEEEEKKEEEEVEEEKEEGKVGGEGSKTFIFKFLKFPGSEISVK